jgi:hypothetical protein
VLVCPRVRRTSCIRLHRLYASGGCIDCALPLASKAAFGSITRTLMRSLPTSMPLTVSPRAWAALTRRRTVVGRNCHCDFDMKTLPWFETEPITLQQFIYLTPIMFKKRFLHLSTAFLGADLEPLQDRPNLVHCPPRAVATPRASSIRARCRVPRARRRPSWAGT